MTPRERAIQVVEASDRQGYGCPSFETQAMIEQAIMAAIEEEREECAKIAENVGRSQGAFNGDWPTAKLTAEVIRARSNASHSAEPKVR